MSRKSHKRQLDRARAKRQADVTVRRSRRRRVVAVVMVAVLLLALVAAAVAGQLRGTPTPSATGDPAASPSAAASQAAAACPAPAGDVPTPSAEQYDAPPETTIDPAASYLATIETTCGTITAELFAADAPVTVNNFVFLANEGYYAGTPFHRVIPGFMIQSGDPTGTGTGGPGYTFEDELDTVATYGYPRGTLAMANSGPDSNGSQFFVVQGDASHLETHTVFGRVIDGMEVVDDIVAGPVEPGSERPVEPVLIESVTIEQQPSPGAPAGTNETPTTSPTASQT